MIHLCQEEIAAFFALLAGGPALWLWVKAKFHARFCCRHTPRSDR